MFNSLMSFGSKYVKVLDKFKTPKEEPMDGTRIKYMGGEPNPIVDRHFQDEKTKDDSNMQSRKVANEIKKQKAMEDKMKEEEVPSKI